MKNKLKVDRIFNFKPIWVTACISLVFQGYDPRHRIRNYCSPYFKIIFVLFYCILLLSVACTNQDADESKICDYQSGTYNPSYTEMEGTCGSFTPLAVTIATIEDPNRIHETQEALMSGMILTTRLLLKNCDFDIERELMRDGRLEYTIQGSFHIEGATALSGTVARTEYNEDGTVACTSNYQATLSLAQ